MISGVENKYRGRFFEGSTGKSIANTEKAGIIVTVTTPSFKSCPKIEVKPDINGIFQFNLPVLNNSVPYAIKLTAERPGGYLPISFD